MSINLITGYDLTRDEAGERRNTSSPYSPQHLFQQHFETLRTNAIRRPIPLADDSDTEWLYTQEESDD
jgi:hypothetical protein